MAGIAGLLVLAFPPPVAGAPHDAVLSEVVEQVQNAPEDVTDGLLAVLPPSSSPQEGGAPPTGGNEVGSPDPPREEERAAPVSPPPSGATLESGDGDASDPAPAAAPNVSPERGEGAAPPTDRELVRGDRPPSGGVLTGAPPAGTRSSPEGQPTTLERIVAVVPTQIRVALAVLVLLVLGSLLANGRTRRRLAQAEQRAATDPLTGLPNRISAEEALERMLAQSIRSGTPVSVALFDLDCFKAVNDTFGHGAGDEALRRVAQAVRERVRGGDHVARFGGEEFTLLLPDTDRDGAVKVAEILRAAIADLEIDGPGTVTASFGVASMPADATNSTDLVAAADGALYTAKHNGRDRVEAAGSPAAALEPVG